MEHVDHFSTEGMKMLKFVNLNLEASLKNISSSVTAMRTVDNKFLKSSAILCWFSKCISEE